MKALKRTMMMILVVGILFVPIISIAGSLEPPPHAVNASGNPVSTTHPKIACRGEFMVNGSSGTVTDCRTGLIWMQNANCFPPQNWATAMASCASLATGTCGLLDRSSAGDWHLPTLEELLTLPNRFYSNPPLSNELGDAKWTEGNAFNNVQLDIYWTATTGVIGNTNFWGVNFNTFGFGHDHYNAINNVWCVRGRGQSGN